MNENFNQINNDNANSFTDYQNNQELNPFKQQNINQNQIPNPSFDPMQQSISNYIYDDGGNQNASSKGNKKKYLIFGIGGLALISIALFLFFFFNAPKLKFIVADDEIVTYVNAEQKFNFGIEGSGKLEETMFTFKVKDEGVAEVDNELQIGSDVENEIKGIEEKATTLNVIARLGNKTVEKEINVIVCNKIDIDNIIENKLSVEVGKEIVLGLNLGDNASCYSNLDYKLSTEGVASITDSYTLKGIAVGNTKLTISDGTNEQTFDVEVFNPKDKTLASNINISAKVVTLTVGRTKKINASISPSNTSNKRVIWESTNTEIATVSQSGVIKAIKPGTLTVMVTTLDGSNKQATIKVKVIAKKTIKTSSSSSSSSSNSSSNQIQVESIKFSEEKYSGSVGSTSINAGVIFSPTNASNKTLKSCMSANTKIATATVKGNICVITPVGAGITSITATSALNEIKAKTVIEVTGKGTPISGVCCSCASQGLAGTGALVWSNSGKCSSSCTKNSKSQSSCKNPVPCTTSTFENPRGCANQVYENSTEKATCTNVKVVTGTCSCKPAGKRVSSCNQCGGSCSYITATTVGTGYYYCVNSDQKSGACTATSTASTCSCPSGWTTSKSTCSFTYKVTKTVCKK